MNDASAPPMRGPEQRREIAVAILGKIDEMIALVQGQPSAMRLLHQLTVARREAELCISSPQKIERS